MTEKEKKAIKILLGLYKQDTIDEDKVMELLECIVDKPTNTYYYPWWSGIDQNPLTPQYTTTTTTEHAELS